MNPEFRNTDPIQVIFVRRNGPCSKASQEAFGVLCPFAASRGLFGPSTRVIGVTLDDPRTTEESKMRFDACITVDREVEPEGEIGRKALAGGKYAVFVHAGPYDGFQKTYEQIFSVWLPSSGERLRDDPCFEVYVNDPGHTKPEDLRTEIWIPVR
ncbi:MAG TPA: GyrI-like domain-containing protein [Polyangiaceae bacterium]|nr:GyrI-like domain-containing protein [Polyangiaceae bacterium]